MLASSSQDHREIGRRIGYDLVRYRRRIDEASLPASIVEGVADARSHGLRGSGPDRFVAKWLQLRLSAYCRDRVFDERVDPTYLREIDVAVCPVTREVLTHGTLGLSDWSIDRLNNEGAYVPSNLAVMSTRANNAKGRRSFDDVLARAGLGEATGGLAPTEWMRLAALMLGPCFVEHASRAPLIPLTAPIPSRTVRPATQLIQYVFTEAGSARADRNRLVRQFGAACRSDVARHRLERFAETMHVGLKQVSPCWDVWLRPDVMDAFVAWRDVVDPRSWWIAGEVAKKIVGGRRVDAASTRAWHLQRHGYFH